MPRTPDRTPGPSDEEEIQFEDRTADGDPTVAGALRYTGGALKAKDSIGVFDLRTGGSTHGATHITGGVDEVDGDQLDIDWNPTNYVPDTTPSEVFSTDHLAAHLAGIDNALASSLPVPSQIGELLFSKDGVTFSVTDPLTSPDGWLANDLGELLYVS